MAANLTGRLNAPSWHYKPCLGFRIKEQRRVLRSAANFLGVVVNTGIASRSLATVALDMKKISHGLNGFSRIIRNC